MLPMAGVEADELVPLLRGVSHFWAFWFAVVGAVVLARRPPRFIEDADDEGVVR